MKKETAAVWVDIDSLKPWEDNPRINDKAISSVVDSIKRFGFASPIIARKETNEIIAGHTRFKAARVLQLAKVPVRFMDLDPVDSKLLALADNRVGEIADWDDDRLRTILEELADEDVALEGLGWTDEEIADLLGVEIEEEADEQIIPESFEVIVLCKNEREQAKALEYIEEGGFECNALIS